MSAGFDGKLLGGKPERIPSHGMQHIVPLAALIAGDDICSGVSLEVSDMQARTARVGEHVQNIIFRFVVSFFGTEALVFIPVCLPFFLYGVKVVTHAFLRICFCCLSNLVKEKKIT